MSQGHRDPGNGINQHLNVFGPLGRLDQTNGWRMDVMGNSSAGDYLLTQERNVEVRPAWRRHGLVADPIGLRQRIEQSRVRVQQGLRSNGSSTPIPSFH